MNGISQNGEPWWAQNDPKPCLQGDLNPDQWILAKKAMEKIKNYTGNGAKCKVCITLHVGIKSHSEKGKKDAVFLGVYGQKSSSHFERLFSLIFWHE